MTIELKILMDLRDDGSEPSAKQLARAVYHAVKYALHNDIAEAECLNNSDVGKMTVEAVDKFRSTDLEGL
jgi:hypothetical protein